jgi:hypothetical protein
MATNTSTTRRASWERAYRKYTAINHRLEQAQPHERDQLEQAVAAQQEDLLEMNAPHLVGVLHKLEVLWEGQLEGLDQESEFKRLILEDLSDLCAQGAAVIGYSSPFAPKPGAG